MPRNRSPKREEAFRIWKQSKGKILLKDIASQLGVSDELIRKWKNQDQWERKENSTVTLPQDKSNVTNRQRSQKIHQEQREPETEIDETQDLQTTGITDKQRRFADEYLIDLNATQAAIRAGYSPRSAQQQSSELLSKPVVRDYIDRHLAAASRRTGVNLERIIREYARIAFANPRKLVDFKTGAIREEASDDDMAAIASIRVKAQTGAVNSIEREVRFANKQQALERLEKYFGHTLTEEENKQLNEIHIQIEREKLELEKQKIKAGPDDESIQKINHNIESLAELINNPVPNRKIEDE